MDLGSLAADCPAHTTGADLYALCSEALLMALRRTIQTLEEERAQGSAATAGGEGGEGVSAEAMEDGAEALIVTKDDFLSAMAHLTPSVAKSELERYQELRKSAVANTSPPHETDHFTDM